MPIVGRLARWAGAIPIYRQVDGADMAQNDATFAAVYEALERGEAICLFPEGISHDEPEIQPLKTGAARMALGAEAQQDWLLGVRILPVGLTYRSKARFQSSVAIEIGEPLRAAAWRESFRADPTEAARDLTEAIRAGMERVTLNLENWQDLPLLRLAAQLVAPSHLRRGPRASRHTPVAAKLGAEVLKLVALGGVGTCALRIGRRTPRSSSSRPSRQMASSCSRMRVKCS